MKNLFVYDSPQKILPNDELQYKYYTGYPQFPAPPKRLMSRISKSLIPKSDTS